MLYGMYDIKTISQRLETLYESQYFIKKIKKMNSAILEQTEIILVDDDKIDCAMVERRLLKLGDQKPILHVFHEGMSALSFIKSKIKVKDHIKYLIMLDINLPSMNGFEVLNYLNGFKSNKIAVCICTTSNSIYDRQKAETMGVPYYVKQELSSDKNLLGYIVNNYQHTMLTIKQPDRQTFTDCLESEIPAQ